MADLSVSFSQAFSNKIIAAAKIPYVLVNESKKFEKPKIIAAATSFSDPQKTLQRIEREAKKTSKDKKKDPWAQDFLKEVGEYRDLMDRIDQSRIDAKKMGIKNWSGPSKNLTKDYRIFGDWDVKAHARKLKVTLISRPKIKLVTPVTQINNFEVRVAATGELWVKTPWFKCVKRKWGICYKWKKVTKWTRVASISVSPRIKTQAKITFAVKNVAIYGYPRFIRLRLNYAILKEIPLELIANVALDGDKDKGSFEVLSKDDLKIEMLGKKFSPKKLQLPPDPSGLSANAIY